VSVVSVPPGARHRDLPDDEGPDDQTESQEPGHQRNEAPRSTDPMHPQRRLPAKDHPP
jgi:hypothetical protein